MVTFYGTEHIIFLYYLKSPHSPVTFVHSDNTYFRTVCNGHSGMTYACNSNSKEKETINWRENLGGVEERTGEVMSFYFN